MSKAKFVMSNGMKAYVSAQRRKVMEEAPHRLECPKCKADRVKKAFGVRTFKDATGKPTRFAMQSYCTPCRNGKTKKTAKKAPKAKATKQAAPVAQEMSF